MFSFDEELFNNAYEKILDAQVKGEDVKNTCNLINNFDVACDFKSKIEDIIFSLAKLLNTITELSDDMKLVKYLYELSNDQFYLYKTLFQREGSSEDFFKLLLEMSTSPYSCLLGQYGGNQNGPRDLFYKYVLHRNEMSDVEIQKFNSMIEILKKRGIVDANEIDYLLMYTKNTGCGFVVVANLLCDLYKDNPDDFEKKYGYPLYYKKDGVLYYNYESIIVDAFLQYNEEKWNIIANHSHQDSFFKQWYLSIGGFDLENNTSLNFNDMGSIVHSYDSNIDYVVADGDMTIETYRKYINSGEYDYACIGVYNFKLIPYGMNSNVFNFYCSGGIGHWMSIVDITPDNRYIVSSWGKEWILDGGVVQQGSGGLVFFKVGDIGNE